MSRARRQLVADRERFPGSWATYGQSRDGGPVGESGRWQQHSLLLDSTEFDWVVELLLTHARVMPVIRQIVGPELCLSGFFSRMRDPVLEPPPPPVKQTRHQSAFANLLRRPGSARQESRVEGSTGEAGVHWRMWVSVAALFPG